MNFRSRQNNTLRLFGALLVPMVLYSAQSGAATVDAFASDGSTTFMEQPDSDAVTTQLSVDFGSTNGLWLKMNQATTDPNEKISLKLTNQSGALIDQVSVQIIKAGGEFEARNAIPGFFWFGGLQVVDTGSGANDAGFIDDLDDNGQGFFWRIDPLGAGGEITINIPEWTGFGTDGWFLNIDLNDRDTTLAQANGKFVDVVRTPLPGAIWLLGSGMLGLARISRSRRNG